MTTINEERTKVFISYSHKDLKWLERLQVHLKPLERAGRIQRWDDTKIEPGQHWKEEIERAIATSKVAVLLISADFLASDFIVNNELPPLLTAAENDGLVVMPVILYPCGFSRTPELARFQSVNPPNMPMYDMSKSQREALWSRLAGSIDTVLTEKERLLREQIEEKKIKQALPMMIKVVGALRVLICEDEGLTVMALRKALWRAGHEVVGEAVEGRTAVELARTLEPDLVIIDINLLGGIDGLTVARCIYDERPVPIVMLTAYSDDLVKDAAWKAGATGYHVKPSTESSIYLCITEAVSRFRAQQILRKESISQLDELKARERLESAVRLVSKRDDILEAQAFQFLMETALAKGKFLMEVVADIVGLSDG